MDGDRDLQLLLLALRDRVVDPGRLADAAGDWDRGSGLMSYLTDRGVLSADDLRRLESVDPAQATTAHRPEYDDATTAAGNGLLFDGTPPAPTDRYEVLRLHQSGGLGHVWLARDKAIGRDVALKTLRAERTACPATRARFVREARVTGQLEHPSIVPLYDLAGGAEPFYVMRFVSGRTLAEAATDYHRRRANKTAGPLDLNTLLDAFVSVCRAVAFAHARDVLHRDLKGQNIVVGEYGEVFLLDWGLAKPAGEADAPWTTAWDDGGGEMTAPGSAVGTPSYMAPEVAAGGTGTKASDVYGLGAILYTLLTGRPPFTGPSASDVIAMVTTVDPVAVLAANPAAPPALAAVCRKAMARDPAGRYPSADEVATEVRRYLADEPVAAHREAFAARAGRWTRRRKTAVASAAVLLLTATVASTAAAGLVWREEQQTKLAWQQAEAKEIEATANADTAMQVVRDLTAHVHTAEFSGIQSVRNDQQRKITLDASLASYERLLALHPDDAAVKANVARLYRYRANLRRLLNETADAETSYRIAIRHYGELAAVRPSEPTYRVNVSEASRDFALFLRNIGRLREASVLMDESIRVFKELPGASSENPDYQRLFALTLIDRSELDYQLGRYAESERTARASTELYAKLMSAPSSRAAPLDSLFRGMAENGLALALRELGRVDEALAAQDAAVERLAGLSKVSQSRDSLHLYHRFRAERAWTCSRVPARRAAAIADLDDATLGWEKLSKEYPLAPLYQHWNGLAYQYRGRLNAQLARRDAALQDLTMAAKIHEELVEKHQDIPVYRNDLGETYTALGRLATGTPEAAGWYRKARDALGGAVQRNPDNAQYRQALKELDALVGANR